MFIVADVMSDDEMFIVLTLKHCFQQTA